MTNEEAIKDLKKLKSFHNGSYGAACNKAIDWGAERLRPKKQENPTIIDFEIDSETEKALAQISAYIKGMWRACVEASLSTGTPISCYTSMINRMVEEQLSQSEGSDNND